MGGTVLNNMFPKCDLGGVTDEGYRSGRKLCKLSIYHPVIKVIRAMVLIQKPGQLKLHFDWLWWMTISYITSCKLFLGMNACYAINLECYQLERKTEIFILPVSQWVPVYPSTQLHVYWYTPSSQVAPFMHGSLWHSLMSGGEIKTACIAPGYQYAEYIAFIYE